MAQAKQPTGAAEASNKKPSSVKLTAFCLYQAKRDAKGRLKSVTALDGAQDARIGDDGRVELLASSVPWRSKKFAAPQPGAGFGMLLLYGIKDTLEELYRWRNKARQIGADFAYAEFDVEVGIIEPGLVSRDLLKTRGRESRFANLRRMNVMLQGEILQAMRKHDPAVTKMVDLAARPHLFDMIFEDDKEIANLDVFVIPVADDDETPGLMRQVAYVRPGSKILGVNQGSDQASIFLPSWMTDKKMSAALRKEALASR